jgi:hypothetical protein
MKELYQITMYDGSVWTVPVILIATNHAEYYAEVDEVSFEDALKNDTIPLFTDDPDEIEEWAKNNMDWDDVSSSAVCVKQAKTDFDRGWMDGEIEITNE